MVDWTTTKSRLAVNREWSSSTNSRRTPRRDWSINNTPNAKGSRNGSTGIRSTNPIVKVPITSRSCCSLSHCIVLLGYIRPLFVLMVDRYNLPVSLYRYFPGVSFHFVKSVKIVLADYIYILCTCRRKIIHDYSLWYQREVALVEVSGFCAMSTSWLDPFKLVIRLWQQKRHRRILSSPTPQLHRSVIRGAYIRPHFLNCCISVFPVTCHIRPTFQLSLSRSVRDLPSRLT